MSERPDLAIMMFDYAPSGVVRNALRIAGAGQEAGLRTEVGPRSEWARWFRKSREALKLAVWNRSRRSLILFGTENERWSGSRPRLPG